MPRFNRVNADGLSLTETNIMAEAAMPATFVRLDVDGNFEKADSVEGQLYILNPAYSEGLSITDEIPAGTSAVADYVEAGREVACLIAAGTYKKDEAVTIGVNGKAETGDSNTIGYIQEDVTLDDENFVLVRIQQSFKNTAA